MRSEKLSKVQELTRRLSSCSRVSGSEGIREARAVVRDFLREHRFSFLEESFEVEKLIPVYGEVRYEKVVEKAFPFVGSLWGDVEAEVTDSEEDVKGKIALVKVGGRREVEKVKSLKEKGAVAVVFFSEEVDSPFIGNADGGGLIVVSVSRSVASRIKGKKVRIISKVRRSRVKGKNLMFEVGKGPIVYVTAHLDSKPFVYGSIDNALSVALVLLLAEDIRGSYGVFSRFRFLITDCEEMGLEGSLYHVNQLKRMRHLKYVRYAINVDSIGWMNPAVIYKDHEGYNGKRIMDAFYRHTKELKIDIPFREGKRGMSDHIPFKREGVETLFLSSNPFTIRHTFYDVYESIDWDVVSMWYEVLSSFLKRLYRF